MSPTETDEPSDRRRVRELFDRLADGDFQSVHETFAPHLRDAVPVGHLAEVWRDRVTDEPTVLAVDTDGETVSVTFRTGERRHRLDVGVDETGTVTALLFADPDEATPAPYSRPEYVDAAVETDSIVVGTDDRTVHAEVVEPPGEEATPGVVVVPGSGATDADGYVDGARPYRDIACGLASAGIATIRYHKRPVTDTEPSIDPLVRDAVAVAESFAARPTVDAARLAGCGHSLGGYLLPAVAERSRIRAGVVIGAPCGNLLAAAADQFDRTVDTERLAAAAERHDRPVFGFPPTFWTEATDRRPTRRVARLGLPTLACHAGDDEKVARTAFERWCTGPAADHVDGRTYPSLPHTFVAAASGHVPRRVVDDVTRWLWDRFADTGEATAES